MNYIKNILFLLSSLFICDQSIAQRKVKSEDIEEKYRTFTSVGITTNTNSGILGGAVFRRSSAVSATFKGKDQYKYLAVEVVNVKHPKEYSTPDFGGTGTRWIYDKKNYLFSIRPEYGRELVLFNRHEDEGITVSAILAAGPTIGLEKPYMIQYNSSDGRVITAPYDPATLQNAQIIGSGSFFQGFGKSKIVPGIHVKTALSFELSAFRDNVTGIEIGFLAEGFTRKIDLMASAQNKSIFTSGFITLYFGNKKR